MKTADIHSQLQALISSCIDEGDYDPAEDYIKDPFCRRTMHTASLAINEIDTLRARVAELEADIKEFQDQSEADGLMLTQTIKDRDRWKAEAMAWRAWWRHPDTEVHREHWEMRKKIDAARAANERGEG